MAIENLQANKGIFYKILSRITKKDYYKAPTGTKIKTDRGKGSVSYNKDTGEITCDGLQNAIIKGTAQNDKIKVQNSKNVKVSGGDADDEFTIKYSDTVQIDGGNKNDEVILYDNPLNIKLTNVEKKTLIYTQEPTVTPTKPLREFDGNGKIESSRQGGIGDCWFLSEINSMSYTEKGRKIIKDSIVWDDKNRQATVHCKGLGVDMTVSYDELKRAKKNGSQYYGDSALYDKGRTYSEGDDDVFLLEYVMAKLDYLEDKKLINFEAIGSRPNLFKFLAGAEVQPQIFDEAKIKEFLNKLEADGGKNLVACASTPKNAPEGVASYGENVPVTDANGKNVNITLSHAYAIKEVKNGLVTVVNPWDSDDESKYTATFTYDDFCKYFTISDSADLSKPMDETPIVVVEDGSEVDFSDYGISLTSSTLKINEFKNSDERIIFKSKYKLGSNPGSLNEYTEALSNQIIKDIKKKVNNAEKFNAFKYTDKNGVAHCYINDNGNIRYFTGDDIKNYNYKLIEEKEMTQDEFKNYIISIVDGQEYIKKYTVYSD